MRFIVITVIVMFTFTNANAGWNDSTFCRWSLQQEIGMLYSLSDLKTGAITDHLISVQEPNPYWMFFKGTFNLSPRLSLFFSYQMNVRGDNKRGTKFVNALEQAYADKYFISSTAIEYMDKPKAGFIYNVERSQFGIVYNMRIGKLTLSPSISAGLTTFYADLESVKLKEKGTNQTYLISYTAERRPKEFFTYSPGLMVSYPITNRLDLYLQATYFSSSYDFTYLAETTNIFDQTSTTEYFPYKGTMNALSTGIGLRININEIYQRSYLRSF